MNRIWALVLSGLLTFLPCGVALSAEEKPVAAERPLEAERLYGPNAQISLAAADIPNTAALKYPFWLALGNIPIKERLLYKQSLDFVLNSLSRSRIPKPSRAVPDADNLVLLVVDLADYKIDYRAIGRLIDKGSGNNPLPEYYFYVSKFIEEEYNQAYGHKDASGNWVTTRTEKERRKVKKSICAPWVSKSRFADLQRAAHSDYPIVRGDWFLVYAMLAPAYYDLLGLDPVKGTEADFLKLVRADDKLARGLELTGIADTKIVTLHNRRLVRIPTVNGLTGGYSWQSQDTDDPVEDGDYLNELVRPKVKAKELIASLANGLQAYALVNADGLLQKAAPITIARDKKTRLNSAEVFNGLSCVTCHDQGLWEIDDKVRKLAENSVTLFVTHRLKANGKTDQEEVDAVVEQFIFQPTPVIQHDRLIYSTAVAQVNGLTPQKNAKQFEDLCWNYLDRPLTLTHASFDCGVPEDILRKNLEGAPLDHTATSLVRGVAVSRIPYERQGFSVLMNRLMDAGIITIEP